MSILHILVWQWLLVNPDNFQSMILHLDGKQPFSIFAQDAKHLLDSSINALRFTLNNEFQWRCPNTSNLMISHHWF